MAFINSSVLIPVLLPGAVVADVVPVIISAVAGGTFGANVDPVVEGTALVTIGIIR